MQTWKKALAGIGVCAAFYGSVLAYDYFAKESVWLDLLHGYVLQEQQIDGTVILSEGLEIENGSRCVLKIRVAPVSFRAEDNGYDRPDFHLQCGDWVFVYEDDGMNALNAERRMERYSIETTTSTGGKSANVAFSVTDEAARITADTGEHTVVFLDPAKSPAQRLEIALDSRARHTDIARDERLQCGRTYFSFVREGMSKWGRFQCKGSLPRW